MNVTPHITLDNLIYHPTAVRMGISNVPPDDLLPNLMRLCTEVGEPIYTLLGGKMAFLSGYRSAALQAALVRQGKKSTHSDGLGMDFTTPGMDITDAFDKIVASDIPYDTLTWVWSRLGSNWLEATIPKTGEGPRRIHTRGKRDPDRILLA